MVGWRPLIKSIFAKELSGSLLRLVPLPPPSICGTCGLPFDMLALITSDCVCKQVHLSHNYKLLAPPDSKLRAGLSAGDVVDTAITVNSVLVIPGECLFCPHGKYGLPSIMMALITSGCG